MIPVIISKLGILTKPIDFNKKINNKPIFGTHKTIGGTILGIIFGIILFYIQTLLYDNLFFQNLSIVNYSQQTFLLGFLLSFGAIFGDLVKSFIKRRIEINEGSKWSPFDQLDYVIGGLLLSFLVVIPSIEIILTILILSPFLTYLVNIISYSLKIKSVRW